jgi:divalent metal cation (Fe/Co/Zn/Cd) transporter
VKREDEIIQLIDVSVKNGFELKADSNNKLVELTKIVNGYEQKSSEYSEKLYKESQESDNEIKTAIRVVQRDIQGTNILLEILFRPKEKMKPHEIESIKKRATKFIEENGNGIVKYHYDKFLVGLNAKTKTKKQNQQ